MRSVTLPCLNGVDFGTLNDNYFTPIHGLPQRAGDFAGRRTLHTMAPAAAPAIARVGQRLSQPAPKINELSVDGGGEPPVVT